MSGGAFSVGVSALLVNQRQLATTSHNIANVNTEGYSRQRVEQSPRPAQFVGAGFLGKGVDVSTISREVDEFLNVQLRNNASGEARASIFSRYTDQVDAIVSDGTFGPVLEGFFKSLRDVTNDPASVPAREVFLTNARTLSERFQDFDARFSVMERNLNQEIGQRITQLNTYAESLASLNKDITQAIGTTQGHPPNDLLDQRDLLLQRMAEMVNISTVDQTDGSVNVFVGNGKLLVAGGTHTPLIGTANLLDGGRVEVSLATSGGVTEISDTITNGELAGILAFREQILDPSRNAIGRLAAGINITMNDQHNDGMDLNGALGADLFSLGTPVASALATNTGTVSMSLDFANTGNLTDSDYDLIHNGTDFVLTRKLDGVQRTLSGAGPFFVDGMTIAIGTAPAAGDQYLLQPTRLLSRGFSTLISDPRELAMAGPVKSSAALTNIGSGRIDAATVTDVSNPALLTPTQLVFANPPTAYQVNGAGPLVPYTAGADINMNGWVVKLTGTPAAGDTFRIDPNSNGRGDNRNGLAMAGLQTREFLVGGTASYQDAYSQLVGRIGARTQQAQISRDALAVQRDAAQAARDEISGVNLDEEAANLIRFQQAFQAAAQLIQVTNEAFRSLIDATR